ncbi:hypothetical protein OW715_14525 [Acidithiobacillus ferriphilus]|nr:hypothetical protein [Acidithiobacillus ferriphilus]
MEGQQQEARAAARAHAMAETRKALVQQRAQMQEKMQTQDGPAVDRMMSAGSVKGPTMRPGSETERGQVVMAVEMDHPGLTDTQKLIIRNQMGIQPGEGWQNRETDRKAVIREQTEINKQMRQERQEQMIRKAAEAHAHPTAAEQTRQADDRTRFAEDRQAQEEQDMWHKDHSHAPRARDDERENVMEKDDLEKGVNEK